MVEKAGNSNVITRQYLDSLLIETRYMNSTNPDLTMNLYGRSFKSPIMTAALSHLDQFMFEGATKAYAEGTANADAILWLGMADDKHLPGARHLRDNHRRGKIQAQQHSKPDITRPFPVTPCFHVLLPLLARLGLCVYCRCFPLSRRRDIFILSSFFPDDNKSFLLRRPDPPDVPDCHVCVLFFARYLRYNRSWMMVKNIGLRIGAKRGH